MSASPRKLSFETCEGRRMMSASPISIEAESMAIVSGSWNKRSDSGASGKLSMVPTIDNKGELSKAFTVTDSGEYSVTVFFKAPDLKANSLAYRIDDGPIREVALPKTSGYQSQMQSIRENLTAGPHTLHVLARENGTRIDRFDLKFEGTVTPPPPTNKAPVANAGADQAKVGTLSATLAGSVSDDGLPTGSAVTSVWSKISGPGSVTFGNAASPTTGASFSAYGTYVLRLSVSDGQLSGSDDVTISLAQQPVDPPPSGNIIRVTGDHHDQTKVTQPGDGVTIDLAGGRFYGLQNNYGLNTDWPDPVEFGHKSQVDHNAFPSAANLYPLTIKGTSQNFAIHGGLVQGEFDPKAPWHVWKGLADGDGLRVEGKGLINVSSVRIDNSEDGFSPQTADDSHTATFNLKDQYYTRIHDDMVENDSKHDINISDSFMQGHTFYSMSGTSNPNAKTTIKNVVVELILQPHEGRISGQSLDLKVNTAGGYPYPDGLGCGSIWKTDGGGKDGTIAVENSVFLVPRNGTSSMDSMRLDVAGITYKNVTIVWLGDGDYPSVIPPGVTITKDRSVFDNAKASFFAAHPQFTEGQVVNNTPALVSASAPPSPQLP